MASGIILEDLENRRRRTPCTLTYHRRESRIIIQSQRQMHSVANGWGYLQITMIESILTQYAEVES